MTGAPRERSELRITGRVQGVFFRASARDKARSLGVTGWVRNASDGSVEAVVEGPGPQVEAFVDWARHGPDHAVVDRVDRTSADPTGEFADFEVRP